jgi:hypothetical protein
VVEAVMPPIDIKPKKEKKLPIKLEEATIFGKGALHMQQGKYQHIRAVSQAGFQLVRIINFIPMWLRGTVMFVIHLLTLLLLYYSYSWHKVLHELLFYFFGLFYWSTTFVVCACLYYIDLYIFLLLTLNEHDANIHMYDAVLSYTQMVTAEETVFHEAVANANFDVEEIEWFFIPYLPSGLANRKQYNYFHSLDYNVHASVIVDMELLDDLLTKFGMSSPNLLTFKNCMFYAYNYYEHPFEHQAYAVNTTYKFINEQERLQCAANQHMLKQFTIPVV